MKDSIKREQNKPVCSAERENQRSLAEGKSNFRTKCKMKKVFKKVFLTVTVLIACVLILCLGFWLIDGRSPQAYLVAHALPQTTMEAYEKGKGDMTDKSIVEIPEGVEFPREVKQFKVGSMQVFECPVNGAWLILRFTE